MTVCDLTHAYHETSGGIRTYIDAKRRYVLENTDHTHVLVVPGSEDRVERGERWATYWIKSPLIPGAAPYRFLLRRGAMVEALGAARPDVVELNSLYREPSAAFEYRRRHPGAVVSGYYFTDLPSAYVRPAAEAVAGQWAAGHAERWAERYVRSTFDHCNLVCAPSPAQAERLTRIGVEDVHIVVPGVDLETFHPARASNTVRADLSVPGGAVFAVYVGRLDSEKRTATMVEAVRLANETAPVVLVLAGNGPHRPALEEAQAEGAAIRVLPYQDNRDQLARLLASADVYLTAGPHETFGLSVVEAQACGLPVVGVEAGALVERVPPTVGRLGPVDDAAAMAANLLWVAARRDALGPAARRHVEEQFSWAASFETLFALYREALGRPAPPA
ncbi:glycosyltransferase [Rubrivirga sp. S365]|uniref:Glycosyltransferase n=1 Tax=Rubrivirga litoralis TaxID=3075598 RepID=A0ABU3BLN2_9BACT|nr:MULTISPECIES: glycosyltransferase [unclassified Rubrivirga]MDT0630181.1 glycosyltransferase [Rubrivirga sp. F394]MDT7855692.1 glycosyltransferase [Rubrivirga sp. S365]